MMGNTGNTEERNPLVALFAALFGILLASPFGTIFKANLKAMVVFWVGVIVGIVLSITVDWKVGVLVFAGFWLIAILMLGLGAIRAAKGIKSNSFASDRNDDQPFGDFPSLGDDFPPLFGTTSRRPSHSATTPRHSASTSQANSCESAYGDPSLHGVGTDCEHSASPFEVHKTGSGTDSSAHDGHTIHQDSSDHSSSPSGGSSTGSSDGGGSSSGSSID